MNPMLRNAGMYELFYFSLSVLALSIVGLLLADKKKQDRIFHGNLSILRHDNSVCSIFGEATVKSSFLGGAFYTDRLCNFYPFLAGMEKMQALCFDPDCIGYCTGLYSFNGSAKIPLTDAVHISNILCPMQKK